MRMWTDVRRCSQVPIPLLVGFLLTLYCSKRLSSVVGFPPHWRIFFVPMTESRGQLDSLRQTNGSYSYSVLCVAKYSVECDRWRTTSN